MAIGTAWAEGSWVDAGWISTAWSDSVYVAPKIVVPIDKLLLQGRGVQQRASGGSAHVINLDIFLKKTDFASDTVTYVGRAEPGSALSDAVWQLMGIFTDVNGNIAQKWAEGDVDFDNIWDNRASLTYI